MSPEERFIEQMGIMSQDQGDSRIAGRVLGLLLIEGRELSLQQISERLGVSRASVSTNARSLAKRGAITRTSHAGDRQDFYELNNASYSDLVQEMSDRIRVQMRTIGALAEPIRAGNAPAADRIAEMTSVFGQVAELLENWAATLRQEQTTRKDDK